MPERDGPRGAIAGLPVVVGLLAGTVAYVLGYALTFGLLLLDVVLDGGTPTGGGQLESQVVGVVGTLFYNAHFLTLRVEAGATSDPYHLLDSINLVLPDLAYQAVPAVLLTLAGFLVASRLGGTVRPVDATRAGATVTLAYLPLVVLGARRFAFSGEFFGNAFTVTAPVVESALRAGLLHPLMFGALGGLVYWVAAEDLGDHNEGT